MWIKDSDCDIEWDVDFEACGRDIEAWHRDIETWHRDIETWHRDIDVAVHCVSNISVNSSQPFLKAPWRLSLAARYGTAVGPELPAPGTWMVDGGG